MALGSSGKRNFPSWDNEESATMTLSRELKDERIQLFMKYFDAKANEKIREMEQSFGKLLDMVGSVLAVYLLKMPAAIKQIKLKDFLGGTDQIAMAAVLGDTVVITAVSQCQGPSGMLFRKAGADLVGFMIFFPINAENPYNLFRIWLQGFGLRWATISETKTDYPEERVMTTPVKMQKRKGKAPLASNSKTESKCKAKLTTAKYSTFPKVPQTKPKSSSFSNDEKMVFTSGPILGTKKPSSQGAESKKPSVGDKKSGRKVQKFSYPSASVDKMLPFIKIPLADGQAISAVGEEVNNIDVQSLDPHALQGIQLLVNRLTALCEKAKTSAKHANSL